MAQYDDAAFDEDLADDWEAALEAETKAEEAARLAEEEKRVAKEKKVQKRIHADEARDDENDVTAGTGNMMAEAMGREQVDEAFGSKEQSLCDMSPTTTEDFKHYGRQLATVMAPHRDRKAFPTLFAPLIKELSKKLTSDELNSLLSKIHLIQNKSDGAPKKSETAAAAPRGSRNADVDAFAQVTDRGGAHVTEDQDFM